MAQKKTIFGLLGLLLVFFVGLGSFGIASLVRVSREYSDLKAHDLESEIILSDMQQAFWKLHRALAGRRCEDTAAVMQMASAIKQYVPFVDSPTEASLFSNWNEAYGKYTEARAKFFTTGNAKGIGSIEDKLFVAFEALQVYQMDDVSEKESAFLKRNADDKIILVFLIIVGCGIAGTLVYNSLMRASTAMDALRESEARYRLCLKAARLGAWQFNLKSHKMHWSGTLNDVIDKDWSADDLFSRVHADDRDRVRNNFMASIRQKSCSQEEFRLVRESGEVRWLLTAFDLDTASDGSPQSLLGTFMDVTDKKKAEEARLEAVAKLTALGEIAGGIGHEINNPLAIIQGYAGRLGEELANETVNRGEALAHVQKIESSVQRVAKIVAGLRAFSRNTSNEPGEVFSVKTLVEETLAFSVEKVKRNSVKLVVDPIAEDLLLEGSQTELSQVLVNLLSNAVDALAPYEDRWIRISAARKDQSVEIAVTDSGHGVPAEVRDKMFREAFTTKPIGHGTGLGLKICRRIVERHHGSIALDDRSAHTRFVIALPATN